LATVLSGISFITNRAVVATDSVLVALGLLQKQVSDKLNLTGGTLTGALTINVDSFINGLRIGRGGGNQSTNTANGAFALNANTTGNSNTANGAFALNANTTGNSNTANGAFALNANTTGSNNTANGASALKNNTTGFNNTANGVFALTDNTTGFQNTANGNAALLSNTTGSNNTANGNAALLSNTTGSNNTANGINSGSRIADGITANTISNESVFLGNNTKALANNQTNQIVIGTDTTGAGSNTVTLGNTSITSTILRGTVTAGNGTLLAGTGTTNQLAKFTASGAVGNSSIFDNGNVGIGTTSPTRRLTIDSGSNYINTFFKAGFFLNSEYYSSILIGYQDNQINQSTQFGYVYNTVSPLLSYGHITVFGQTEGSQYKFLANGNFGINQPNPTERLDVLGNGKFSGSINSGSITANGIITGNQIASVSGITGANIRITAIPEYADNAAALANFEPIGIFYRTGDILKVVH